MTTGIMKRAGFSTVLFLCFLTSFSQTNSPFKIRYQSFVKGDMVVLANNIVNRVDYDNNANEPYYNRTNAALLNDESTMQYIDIDEDESTFSSSSAELFFKNPSTKKISYAGLYWSATYKYNAGEEKKEGKFTATDSQRNAFSSVKLKLPNKEKYVDITGQVLFDGINQNNTIDAAPYAVYADITDYVKQLSNPTGIYTVANIRATQGKLSGGISGGWTLFIVYEDQTETQKFITSYDGFVGAKEATPDLVFNGYQAPLTGNVTAKIACAAIDGDYNVLGDQLLFSSSQSKPFTPLKNCIRKDNDFFNSSISAESQFMTNRFPDCKNTLGYDTCLLTIANPNNSVIENGNKESFLRLKSTGDQYFMFFTACSIEITPKEGKEINYINENAVGSLGSNSLKVISNNDIIKFVPANNELLAESNQTTSSFNRMNKYEKIDLKNKLIEVQTVNISSQSEGYYLIANIFKTEESTKQFIAYLKSKKIEAEFFTNPLNNYKYVYLKKTASQPEAIELLMSNMDNSYQERLQILAINKTKQELIADSKPKETTVKQPVAEQPKVDIQVASIPNEAKGYYIVANVFSVKDNSIHFINDLNEKGLNPKLLINPLNEYRYVYLKRVDTEQEAIALYLSKVNNTYQQKIWILSVNNNATILTSNDD